MQQAQRNLCPRCLTSTTTCYCDDVRDISTSIQFVILQHPLERKRTVGTARMAHRCLKDSFLIVGDGTKFDENPRIQLLLEDPNNYCAVLYPGAASIDVSKTPVGEWLPAGKKCVVFVIDGTWHCAKTMLNRSARIAALPRISFTTSRVSEYRFRRQPAAHCLSTIEAVHEVLWILDPGLDSSPLLSLFRNMVARQVGFGDGPTSKLRRVRRSL